MSNPTSVPITIAMPVAGTANAPKFDGKNVDQFLKHILQHGAKAGITDQDDLVDYILEYSLKRVYKGICFDPVFNVDATGRTWKAATTRLKHLFHSRDKPEDLTTDDLKAYCFKWYREGSLNKKSDVDSYLFGFNQIAQSLIKSKEITDVVANRMFLPGIPKHLVSYIAEKVDPTTRTRTSPPPIDSVVDVLYERLGKNSLDWNPFDAEIACLEGCSETTTNKVRFDNSDNDNNTENESKTEKSLAITWAPSKKPFETLKEVNINKSDFEAMMRSMRDLTIAMTSANRCPPSSALQGELHPCFMCGRIHLDPSHPASCPETTKLVSEGLLVRQQSGRYTLPNGDKLPCFPPGHLGGIAALLRDQATYVNTQSNSRGHWDLPPHQSASAGSIMLSYQDQDLFNGDVFAISSRDAEREFYKDYFYGNANPALRSGKNTDAQHDPTSQQNRGQTRTPPPSRPPPQCKQGPPPSNIKVLRDDDIPMAPPSNNNSDRPLSRSRPPTHEPKDIRPPTPSKINVPAPPNPINRQDGWHNSLPSKNQQQNPKPRDDKSQVSPSGMQFHYTSDIQDKISPAKVLGKVWDQDVTVSVAELVGCSPALQKMMAEMTRMKRQYNLGKESNYASLDYSRHDSTNLADVPYNPAKIAKSLRISQEDVPKMADFLVRYSSAVLRIPLSKYYAMVTVIISISIDGIPF
ncbi:hypothetical protein BT96DRAFT_1064499 [Gymnopus androsaceus JB14]|uniref:DUF4100 domain-containing protein n=1 Tax=Gymnopus androsaceus JB14 TaxID=1447944 RepID=A0A6A4GXB8_9AGAR|nr:hypothetical protein BT96DRAFT_1064499 [Gymnopus androsaceus JB14]